MERRWDSRVPAVGVAKADLYMSSGFWLIDVLGVRPQAGIWCERTFRSFRGVNLAAIVPRVLVRLCVENAGSHVELKG